MRHKVRVACIVNKVGSSNIPLENFAGVSSREIEKHLVVFQQSKKEAESFINNVYPNACLQVHSCAGKKIFFKGGSMLSLIQLIKHLQPDVVHTHHTRSTVAAAILRPLSGFRFLITAHNTFSNYSYKQKVGFGLSLMMSDQIICNSRNTLISLPFYIGRHKRQVIYNGVNFKKLDQVFPSREGAEQNIRIGTISRMVPQKGLDTLIRGFAHTVASHALENVELRLIGDGPEKPRLRAMINKLGLDDHVQFTGVLSREDAYQELADLDIFVVSSLWEGFCNAMVEAAAAGKAVVATNIDPLLEVIGSKNALFFKVGDDNGLSVALKKLCDNPDLRKSLGLKAQAFVRSRYTLEKSVKEYEQVYRTLAKR